LEAKMAADSGLYKTIFVTSGGEAPEMMKSELQQAVAHRDVLIFVQTDPPGPEAAIDAG